MHDLDPAVFRRRRKQFMRALGGDVAILPAAPERTRSHDVTYPFRQDSDLYFLTGCLEPETIAVLTGGESGSRFILFVRPRDPEREQWTGRRVGVEGATERLEADEAYPVEEFDARLPELLDGAQRVQLAFGKYPQFDERVTRVVHRQRRESRKGVRAPTGMVDVRELLDAMRLVKSTSDIELVRRAAEITAEAHLAAMRACHADMFEFELAALIEYLFRKNGALSPGYPTIVGSGENATILHYIDNDRRMQRGELVLIDAGAEYGYFSADITRTFPVGGRFSTPQREIYEVVLAAQKAAIRAVTPGSTMKRVHDAAVRVVVRGLRDLGLLKGTPAELVRDGAFRRFFMHGTGHWLGMDVHDVGSYRHGREWRELEPGMVLTVEPGIYVTSEMRGVPRRYWGIGVRIEDDVLVTRSGREVLTAGVPKEVDAIEAVMTETLQIAV
ncbi:MAG: Xaa-Pro aminopeptidase [Candidatus Eiseniibacteriota bacterium]